eukprot:TRINITY_DN8254_c0_g3_i8.p1 TRINITY_DN8254_c0_g3~~TRINITY_DN8254_c0_g3_i8.p1  ORF type:complete len:421 (+),score=73.93 TRINITY_DN8254_c0_g3_i8:411-1673(+)
MPNYARKDILLWLADKLQKNIEGLADLLVLEVGKTITDAKGEVSRAIDTFTLSAEESVRKEGHFMDLDYSPRGSGYSCLVRRFPVGLVSMITPFNFPINLAAHKIGPAIASGCPFVLKPSDRTPLSAIILGQYLSETNLPDGAFSILPCHLQDAHLLSTDERIRLLSFTGSARVGWQLRKNSGKMKISLELGGNASCILTETADIGVAVDRLIFGSFYANGQSCISVQRIHVHESIIDTFLPLFIEKAKKLKTGDPYLPDTFVGPLIAQEEAIRIERWIKEAEERGAKILCGGTRSGSFIPPTILTDVPTSTTVYCEEVFGPVCIVSAYSSLASVCSEINTSKYGLQAGIFTCNISQANYVYDALHVGGVVINDIPSARVDAMPYGGIKDSGVGREGVTYAMDEFTEMKVMLMKQTPYKE